MTQPTARDLLAAAIHEWWGEERLIREDSDMRAVDYLTTPSGQHLAAIVDAAVAWRESWTGGMGKDYRDSFPEDGTLYAAINAAGAPR